MTVFTNADFISCEANNRNFSTMVVDKGRIVYTGNEIPAQYSKVEKINLGGKCVVPAFADTHIHFESYALFMSTLDVRDAVDFEDMGRMVKEYFKANPKVKFLPAFGCTAHTVKEKRLPERKDLDKMTDVPFMIVKYDGHACVANSAFINTMPEAVKKDPGFNAETGWMYQNAFYGGVNFMTSKVPPTKILDSIIRASDFMAKRGIALIHNVEGVGYKNDIDITTINFVSKGLPQAFRIFFQTMDTQKVVKRKFPRIGGCFRLALDGCFGSEDAALSLPYENDPNNKGFLLYTQEEVNEFCVRANRLGLQITMHAIGDVAVDQALTAYEAALNDFPRKDHRHIIIHADLIPEDMQVRAAKLGICIAVQPAFLYWKHEPAEYLEKILDALRVHTSWAAYMSFDENERGSLQNGLIADFVVLSENPLKVPVDRIENIKVEDIYFSGAKYKKSVSGAAALVCKALLHKAR